MPSSLYRNGRAFVAQPPGDRWFHVYFDGAPYNHYSDLERAKKVADKLAAQSEVGERYLEGLRVHALPSYRALVLAGEQGESAYLWALGQWDSASQRLHVVELSRSRRPNAKG